MMMTDIFPNAEVSHFLKWLKTKDGVGVYVGEGVGEISTEGLNRFILPLCISLQSHTLHLQTEAHNHIPLKHKQLIWLCEWGGLNEHRNALQSRDVPKYILKCSQL